MADLVGMAFEALAYKTTRSDGLKFLPVFMIHVTELVGWGGSFGIAPTRQNRCTMLMQSPQSSSVHRMSTTDRTSHAFFWTEKKKKKKKKKKPSHPSSASQRREARMSLFYRQRYCRDLWHSLPVKHLFPLDGSRPGGMT
ncbi:hypothetical protein LZ31DRAFT_233048 [Colletotrichum somersetense]|nr:hypothetical protein LZ31DRAFT_233048 [Colletotrichum somersetense]